MPSLTAAIPSSTACDGGSAGNSVRTAGTAAGAAAGSTVGAATTAGAAAGVSARLHSPKSIRLTTLGCLPESAALAAGLAGALVPSSIWNPRPSSDSQSSSFPSPPKSQSSSTDRACFFLASAFARLSAFRFSSKSCLRTSAALCSSRKPCSTLSSITPRCSCHRRPQFLHLSFLNRCLSKRVQPSVFGTSTSIPMLRSNYVLGVHV
mmetsp:Transcript_13929/g.32667  ORF Transcript_13929/g.32667 Transcript_13929/m.32667 type:complete len:207 (+) Transcript_13929:587-1207(+)